MLSAAAGPPLHCCLLLTKKKEYQSWMNTGLVGLWLVSLNMFLTTENFIYIYTYLYVCMYIHIYTYTHVKYIFHRDVLLKEKRLNVFTI